MEQSEEILSGFILELRRGTIILTVLSQLSQPKYGYAPVQYLSERGIPVEANTLYPLLRRLEKQGILESRWETSGAKPRKYYGLTGQGKEIYRGLKGQWHKLSSTVKGILRKRERESASRTKKAARDFPFRVHGRNDFWGAGYHSVCIFSGPDGGIFSAGRRPVF